MKQLHAREVLHTTEGNSHSESSSWEVIIKKFGSQQRFYAYSTKDMNVDTLIEFLKMKEKFMPAEDGLTVGIIKVYKR